MLCWVSYYWGEKPDVMAAICRDKRTRDNIRANGVFSMGLVTQELLPLVDYFGGKSGYGADGWWHILFMEWQDISQMGRGEKCFEVNTEDKRRSRDTTKAG